MDKKELLLGSYAPLNAQTGYLPGTLKFALDEGANTFMFYTGAPQNTKRKPVSDFEIPQFESEIKASRIALDTVCIHAPYVINLANAKSANTWEFGVDFLKQEIQRAAAIGVNIINLHPGASVGLGAQIGMDQLVKGLNEVFKTKPQGMKIALETMAGKGTEIGINFDQMAYILNHVDHNEDLGVCIDICHIYDAGYDIKNHWETVKAEFDQKVGLKNLCCMHINDSKFGLGSHKDRHANIGYGQIGFDAINKIVHDADLEAIPKYLETPYIGDIAPYAYEIAMLKNQKFEDFIAKLENRIN